MNPEEQKTSVVIERIYSLLIRVKEKKNTIHYSDCFTQGFDMQYVNKYCHFVQERPGVINNIPYILGAIGRVCNDLKLPPLCCLVVNKETRKCGEGVIVSKPNLQGESPSDFAERVDRPATYNCNNYPQPGTQQAKDFLNLIMNRLREKGLTRE